MRTETLYLGTREEITAMVSKNHADLTGECSLDNQFKQIESTPNKTGIILMKRTTRGQVHIDKWFVQIRNFAQEQLEFAAAFTPCDNSQEELNR